MLTSTGGYPALWFLAAGVPCVLPFFDFFSNVWWFSVMSVVRESLDQKSLSSSSLDLQYVLHAENPLRISSTVLQVLLQLAPACGWCLCDRVRAPFLVTCSSSCFFAGGASCRHYRFQCWSLGLRRPDQDYNLKMLKDKYCRLCFFLTCINRIQPIQIQKWLQGSMEIRACITSYQGVGVRTHSLLQQVSVRRCNASCFWTWWTDEIK